MKYEYLKIIKEQGEFDFEVSEMVEELYHKTKNVSKPQKKQPFKVVNFVTFR